MNKRTTAAPERERRGDRQTDKRIDRQIPLFSCFNNTPPHLLIQEEEIYADRHVAVIVAVTTKLMRVCVCKKLCSYCHKQINVYYVFYYVSFFLSFFLSSSFFVVFYGSYRSFGHWSLRGPSNPNTAQSMISFSHRLPKYVAS